MRTGVGCARVKRRIGESSRGFPLLRGPAGVPVSPLLSQHLQIDIATTILRWILVSSDLFT